MDSIPYFGVCVCVYVFFYAVRFLLCARGKPEKSYELGPVVKSTVRSFVSKSLCLLDFIY